MNLFILHCRERWQILRLHTLPDRKSQSVLLRQSDEFYGKVPMRLDFPHGELWSIGDQPTVSVLLENASGRKYHVIHAPYINDDMTYTENPNGKEMWVFDGIDRRLTMEDFFAKLSLCYK